VAGSILIVDDEPNIRRMLGALLAAEGYEVRDAADGAAAMTAAAEAVPDVVLLDLMMPGTLDGLGTLARLRERDGDLPVIMMSGRAGLSDAVRATKLGAFNFLEKPLSPETVLLALGTAIELRQARLATRALRAELGLTGPLVGMSAPMRLVDELIARVAPSDSRVLITGESGTGKELVAAAIHAASPRRDRPFIRVNCAAIPRDLVESEMFGHERGAFTGAIDRRIGRFELAHTGTLFLDEVADLGPEAQAKLLRAIEAKEIERVGGTRPIRTDVRIVAATNKNLSRAVTDGTFREDLYFRLAVIPIALPPLRDRPDDIPALVEHFTALYRTRTGRAVAAWDRDATRLLQAYRWPGNVRELANIVERITILHAGSVVAEEDVRAVLPLEAEAPPPGAGWPARDLSAVSERAPTVPDAPDADERHARLWSGSTIANPPAGGDGDPAEPRSTPGPALVDALDSYERALITQALAAAEGSVTEAARRLQTDRPNLYRRMRRLGIALIVLVAGGLSLGGAIALAPGSARGQGGDTAVRQVPPRRAGEPPAAGQPPAGADTGRRRAGADTTAAGPPTDTLPPFRADTTLANGAAWWRRWLSRSHPPNYLQLSLSSAHTYNRVAGLPLYAGPAGRRTLPWGRLSGEAYGIVRLSDKLRWDNYHIGQAAHAELEINAGADRRLAIGGRLYDVIDPVEPWQLADGEVGLATLFLHRDYRDYFGRHGASGYATLAATPTTSVTLSYAGERWSTRPVRDPFTLFRNEAAWRPNPALDDGVFHLFGGHVALDTRNDESDPWAGWYATLDIEHGGGVVTSFGPRSGMPIPVTPPGGTHVGYVRGFFDGRRYNRVGPTEQLNFRLVLAGWLGGDQLPLEQRLSVGGAGTLPGFDFRNSGSGPDVTSCAVGSSPPPGAPAQCERIALAQVEFRHDLRVGLADLIRGFPLDGSWVLFADAGRGWLVGAPDGAVTYRASSLPPLSTYRTDAGIGVTLGPFGFYIAQPITPWTDNSGPRLVIRLQQRF
jgi:two-component system nitrogen regulation response regulator NtrX